MLLVTDPGAHITAVVDFSDYTITFIQKDADSSGGLVRIIPQDSLVWGGDEPFNPVNPWMS